MKPRAVQATPGPEAEAKAESHKGVLKKTQGLLREVVSEQRVSEKCVGAT